MRRWSALSEQDSLKQSRRTALPRPIREDHVSKRESLDGGERLTPYIVEPCSCTDSWRNLNEESMSAIRNNHNPLAAHGHIRQHERYLPLIYSIAKFVLNIAYQSTTRQPELSTLSCMCCVNLKGPFSFTQPSQKFPQTLTYPLCLQRFSVSINNFKAWLSSSV